MDVLTLLCKDKNDTFSDTTLGSVVEKVPRSSPSQKVAIIQYNNALSEVKVLHSKCIIYITGTLLLINTHKRHFNTVKVELIIITCRLLGS